MVSFNFLKQFDIFKVPVKIYYTRTNKNKKNRHEDKLGSKLGFICSLVLVLFVAGNAVDVGYQIQTGEFDYLQSDQIHHEFKDDIYFDNDNENSEFHPIIQFEGYNHNNDLAELKDDNGEFNLTKL